MRRWIVLATYDNGGNREPRIGDVETLDRVVVFTSGDDERPLDGDLAEALEDYTLDDEGQELLLVPLDAGHAITVRRKTTLDVISRGNLVAW